MGTLQTLNYQNVFDLACMIVAYAVPAGVIFAVVSKMVTGFFNMVFSDGRVKL